MEGQKGDDIVAQPHSLRHEKSPRQYRQIEKDIHQTVVVTDKIWLCKI
jgi:hypothetical protein